MMGLSINDMHKVQIYDADGNIVSDFGGGMIEDNQLSNNVPLKDAANIFTARQTMPEATITELYIPETSDPGAVIADHFQVWGDTSGRVYKADDAGVDKLLCGNYYCRVYNDAAITVSDSVNTTITYNQESYDPAGMHSPSVNPSRITFLRAGQYHVGVGIRWSTNGTGYRQLVITLNNGNNIAEMRVTPLSAATTAVVLCVDYSFAVNDYIEAKVFQTSGSELTLAQPGGVLTPSMWAHWIGD